MEKDTGKDKNIYNKSEKKDEIRTAVALSYSEGDTAPKIVATGKGFLADKIVDIAKKEDVPLHQDNKLAEALSKLDIGDQIPPELYQVVAEILVYINDVDTLKGKIYGK